LNGRRRRPDPPVGQQDILTICERAVYLVRSRWAQRHGIWGGSSAPLIDGLKGSSGEVVFSGIAVCLVQNHEHVTSPDVGGEPFEEWRFSGNVLMRDIRIEGKPRVGEIRRPICRTWTLSKRGGCVVFGHGEIFESVRRDTRNTSRAAVVISRSQKGPFEGG